MNSELHARAARELARLRDEITMHDLVTRGDEPIRVTPGAASDIRYHRARRRKGPLDYLDGPAELDASDPKRKTVAFLVTVRSTPEAPERPCAILPMRTRTAPEISTRRTSRVLRSASCISRAGF